MKTILVTGAGGQLAQCFKKIASDYPDFDFLFVTSEEMDISNKCQVHQLFAAKEIDYCINCAAYTKVEDAEDENELAFKINAEGVKNLAEVCKTSGTVLIHFSTDYVFDGTSTKPYSETDKTNPINVYGASKLKGEAYIQQNLNKYFIFRTSWLYSEFGHNFLNTILKKAKEKATLNITDSQIGTPTNANDLAAFVMQIIADEDKDFGLYHYSNLGEATWFDFAEAILEISGSKDGVILNKTGFYKTRAKRPEYSVLDKTKLEKTFNRPLLNWKESLQKLINEKVH